MPFASESDLRWYLDGSRDAALGQKSNHASFIARMEGSSGGGATDDTNVQDNLVRDATRARRIADVLERLPTDSQRTLAAYYRPDKLARYWREYTHLLPSLKTYDAAKHGPPDGGLGLKMTTASTTAETRVTALAIRQEAAGVVARAHAEYETLRSSLPREKTRFVGC